MRLLNEYDVLLEGILLKPNMCLPGEASSKGRLCRELHPAGTVQKRKAGSATLTRRCTAGPLTCPAALFGGAAAGLDAPSASPEEVAKYTVRTMMRTIPPSVPGIHFLSGRRALCRRWASQQPAPPGTSRQCSWWQTPPASAKRDILDLRACHARCLYSVPVHASLSVLCMFACSWLLSDGC
jgi:hypothetical protein